MLGRDAVFDRVIIDHLVLGPARVSWSLRYTFADPTPHIFSLQVADTGAPGANNWSTIAGPANGVATLSDPGGRRLSGTNPTTHYRVLLQTPAGVYTSDPQSIYGAPGKYQWLKARELVRGFLLYQGVRGAVGGYLYKRIRAGSPQPRAEARDPLQAVLDPLTGDVVRRQGDTETHGTGFLGGFYAPFPIAFAVEPGGWFEDTDAADAQGNIDPARTARTGRAVLVPPLAHRDVFIAAGSDLRYEVGKVQVVADVAGVPLIGDVELRQLPFDDVDYTLVAPPPPPTSP